MFDGRCLLSDVGDIRTTGQMLTASCLYRGDISSLEVDKSIAALKNKNSRSFVEWIPDNTMSSVCKVPTVNNPISGTFLTNSTAIAGSFTSLTEKFEAMYRRKAFLHNYTSEGMDLTEFKEALSNV